MANIYGRSTDGLDADTGGTWLLAKATLTGAAAIDAAGDNIYLSQAHAESTAGAVTFALAGTVASPTRVICVNDAAEPPTAAATTATITTTTSASITFSGASGNCYYVYGVGFVVASGQSSGSASFTSSNTSNCNATFDGGSISLAATGSSIGTIGNGAGNGINTFRRVDFKFGATGQRITAVGAIRMNWLGGTALAGTATPTTIFQAGTAGMFLAGLDLSNIGSTANLFLAGTNNCRGVIRNSSLPASGGSWSGLLVSGTLVAGERYEMYNCDSADTNYRLWIQDPGGSTKHFVGLGTVDVTGSGRYSGATEITRFSWNLTCSSAARWLTTQHESGEIRVWNDTTGSSKTATAEVIHDSAGSGTSGALNEEDIFLRLEGQVTSGSTKSTITNDGPADALNSGVAQATSTTAWAGPAARANLATYALGDLITLASNPGRIFICKTAGIAGAAEPGAYATAVDGDSVTDATAVFKAMRRNKISVVFTPAERGWVIGTPIACKASAVFYLDPNSFAVT